jgi:tetratricopeptide (TPR) repeat protein
MWINPEYATAWHNLELSYKKTDQYSQAVNAYQQALKNMMINPEDAYAWHGIGFICYSTNQSSKTIEVYQLLKEFEPTMADELFDSYISMQW